MYLQFDTSVIEDIFSVFLSMLSQFYGRFITEKKKKSGKALIQSHNVGKFLALSNHALKAKTP